MEVHMRCPVVLVKLDVGQIQVMHMDGQAWGISKASIYKIRMTESIRWMIT